MSRSRNSSGILSIPRASTPHTASNLLQKRCSALTGWLMPSSTVDGERRVSISGFSRSAICSDSVRSGFFWLSHEVWVERRAGRRRCGFVIPEWWLLMDLSDVYTAEERIGQLGIDHGYITRYMLPCPCKCTPNLRTSPREWDDPFRSQPRLSP